MPRPDPLPGYAHGVVERSCVLPWGVKGVWFKLRVLDQPTEGCTMSVEKLADELGMEAATVSRYRRALAEVGLLERADRVDGRKGYTWYCTLPAGCRPTGRGRAEIRRCGLALDAHLEARGAKPKAGHDPPGERGISRPEAEHDPAVRRDIIRSATPRGGTTGGGRIPRSGVTTSDSQLAPSDTNPKIAAAIRTESEGRRERQVLEIWDRKRRKAGG